MRGEEIAVSSRPALYHYLATAEPCFVLLDLPRDRENGLDLREIRSRSDVPVIVTTAHPLDEVDRVLVFELGADDYLLEPFVLRELLARLKAILRRQETGRLMLERAPNRGGYVFEGWRLERRSRRLIKPNGTTVSLSKSEYALLVAFLDSPQRPLTREHLMQSTRQHEDIFDRSVDVRVRRLRQKIESDPSAPKLILTERGIGYVFAAAVEQY